MFKLGKREELDERLDLRMLIVETDEEGRPLRLPILDIDRIVVAGIEPIKDEDEELITCKCLGEMQELHSYSQRVGYTFGSWYTARRDACLEISLG